MEIPSGAYVMVGAITVGLITATTALVSMLISKEQKISEYRESRRQRIRQEAAQYLAQIDILFKLYEVKLKATENHCLSDEELQEFRVSHKENMYLLFEMRHKLFLRLTPERSTKLKDALVSIEKLFFDSSICEDTLHKQRDSIIREIQGILKYEWEKVKLGEPEYRKTERTSKTVIKVLFLVLLGLLILGVALFCFCR